MKLKTRLLLVTVAAVVPAVLALRYESAQNRVDIEKRTRSEAARIANAVSATHEDRLARARDVLTAVSQLQGVHEADPVECPRLIARLDDALGGYSRFAVLDLAGQIVCAGQPLEGSADR